MVSGLVTSPYDQERICSGEARLIRNLRNSLVSTRCPPNNTQDTQKRGSGLHPRPCRRHSETAAKITRFSAPAMHAKRAYGKRPTLFVVRKSASIVMITCHRSKRFCNFQGKVNTCRTNKEV